MNKTGQATLGLAIIVAITLFLVGMMVVNIMKPEITRARNSSNLDCSNAANISDGTKLTCLAVDLVIPYFMVLVISTAGGLITAKFLM